LLVRLLRFAGRFIALDYLAFILRSKGLMLGLFFGMQCYASNALYQPVQNAEKVARFFVP
jgi:hypothetical protein